MNKNSDNGARKHTSVGDWTLVLDDDCNASLLGSPAYVLFEAGYEYQGEIEPIYVSIEGSDDGSFQLSEVSEVEETSVPELYFEEDPIEEESYDEIYDYQPEF